MTHNSCTFNLQLQHTFKHHSYKNTSKCAIIILNLADGCLFLPNADAQRILYGALVFMVQKSGADNGQKKNVCIVAACTIC